MRVPLKALALALALGCPIMTWAASAGSFDDTLKQHLQAISERDLESLLATVGDDLNLIFPNGQLVQGKENFRNIHTEWFADTQWRMEISEVSRSVGADMATVLLKYELRDVPEPGQGNPRSAFLVLVFAKSDDGWRLIHDQNTRITPPSN
ncbi:MAG: SgcJ/EcaC family oxidoreductase [Xanthomonadales bacterium]|nr:SgcJ/EcaC family oxidoreductase [Xanthomonadales bacterium]